eukprot:4226143-Pyramimonas_sp.AAC.4
MLRAAPPTTRSASDPVQAPEALGGGAGAERRPPLLSSRRRFISWSCIIFIVSEKVEIFYVLIRYGMLYAGASATAVPRRQGNHK